MAAADLPGGRRLFNYSYPFPDCSYPYPDYSYPFPDCSYPYPDYSYPYPDYSYPYPDYSYPYPGLAEADLPGVGEADAAQLPDRVTWQSERGPSEHQRDAGMAGRAGVPQTMCSQRDLCPPMWSETSEPQATWRTCTLHTEACVPRSPVVPIYRMASRRLGSLGGKKGRPPHGRPERIAKDNQEGREPPL